LIHPAQDDAAVDSIALYLGRVDGIWRGKWGNVRVPLNDVVFVLNEPDNWPPATDLSDYPFNKSAARRI